MTAEEIAAWIREQVADPEVCMDDEAACMRAHPVHLGASRDGVVDLAYIQVDLFAEMLAKRLEAGK